MSRRKLEAGNAKTWNIDLECVCAFYTGNFKGNARTHRTQLLRPQIDLQFSDRQLLGCPSHEIELACRQTEHQGETRGKSLLAVGVHFGAAFGHDSGTSGCFERAKPSIVSLPLCETESHWDEVFRLIPPPPFLWLRPILSFVKDRVVLHLSRCHVRQRVRWQCGCRQCLSLGTRQACRKKDNK